MLVFLVVWEGFFPQGFLDWVELLKSDDWSMVEKGIYTLAKKCAVLIGGGTW